MNIVYASNDLFAIHLGISMESLLAANKAADSLDIYVLSIGISPENSARLLSVAGRHGRRLFLVDLSDLSSRFDFPADTGTFDISILGRLFLASALPNLSRVLYLDCDTIVCKDLAPLWQTELSGNLIAAVQEPTIYTAVKDALGLPPDAPYYNSGVFLADLSLWREMQAEKRFLSFYAAHGGQLFAGDQDILNAVFAGKVLGLSPEYNFFTNYRYFSYRSLLKASPSYAAVSAASFSKAKNAPAIIHFCGDERPWLHGNLNPYRKFYLAAKENTPWKDFPQFPASRIYMLLYHAMDLFTFIFPGARLFLSNAAGMRYAASGLRSRARKGGKSR